MMRRVSRRSRSTIALLLFLALAPGCDDESEKGDTPETACCDLDEQPGQGGMAPCIEGASCCADGNWQCNEGDGQPTCEVCSATENLLGEPRSRAEPVESRHRADRASER
jgi:hypothetical protein